MRKLKLLISANSCEPDKESEPCAAVRKIDPSPFLFHCQVVLEPMSPGSIQGAENIWGRKEVEGGYEIIYS